MEDEDDNPPPQPTKKRKDPQTVEELLKMVWDPNNRFVGSYTIDNQPKSKELKTGDWGEFTEGETLTLVPSTAPRSMGAWLPSPFGGPVLPKLQKIHQNALIMHDCFTYRSDYRIYLNKMSDYQGGMPVYGERLEERLSEMNEELYETHLVGYDWPESVLNSMDTILSFMNKRIIRLDYARMFKSAGLDVKTTQFTATDLVPQLLENWGLISFVDHGHLKNLQIATPRRPRFEHRPRMYIIWWGQNGRHVTVAVETANVETVIVDPTMNAPEELSKWIKRYNYTSYYAVSIRQTPDFFKNLKDLDLLIEPKI